MIDKKAILQACMGIQEGRIKEMEQGVKSTRETVTEAVGSMVSWSDTSRFQQGVIADGLALKLEQAKTSLKQLKGLISSRRDAIFIGSVFVLRDTSTNECSYYFLIKNGGGDSFRIDDINITSISITAPLLQGAIGKRKGDRIEFRGKELEITEIQ